MSNNSPEASLCHATANASNAVALSGCTPTPLASYLKALGIFRLLAEQADPDVRACWKEDVFSVYTRLDRQALERFFLKGYHPTPILAPWNGGSGFFCNDNKEGINAIQSSTAERFIELRSSIAMAKQILAEAGIAEKPDGKVKADLLQSLRNKYDERALAWLDAAVLLTEDSPRYPPLLGTGGNDGRLDFTNNYMRRLGELFEPVDGMARTGAPEQLADALFGVPTPDLESSAIGQFAPGNVGAPNGGTGFHGDSTVNRWDFVLMLEGALLFATIATRRLQSNQAATLSYPFTVYTTGSGVGSAALADEETARAETWMPIWEQPAGYSELTGLLSEGRVTLGRRPVRDGLDFARAVSRLGVQRGIVSFQRYGFMRRSGKAYLATPLERLPVRHSHASGLIADLDHSDWLASFRRLARGKEPPARLTSLVRQLEDALFELARVAEAHHVQRVLVMLGRAQSYLADSPKAREKQKPVPLLRKEWVVRADDGSAEFALARSLANLHGERQGAEGKTCLPMSLYFAPLAERYRGWDEDTAQRVVWGQRDLEVNLYALLKRRLLDSERLELPDKPLAAYAAAPPSAVHAWLNSELEATRIAELLAGLSLARIPPVRSEESQLPPLPAAYVLLKPFFCTDAQLRRAGLLSADRSLPLTAKLVNLIWQGRIKAALELAARQIRTAGCPLDATNLSDFGMNGRRLFAALVVPIGDFHLRSLIQPLRIQHTTEPDLPADHQETLYDP